MSAAVFNAATTLSGPHAKPVQAPVKQELRKGDVATTLNFYKANEDGSPPAPTYVDRPETYDRPVKPENVIIRDVTGNESSYSLDVNGFEFVKHVSSEKNFTDDEVIKTQYYPEVEELLKSHTGASRIFIFDHTIRRPAPTNATAESDPRLLRGPVQRVHIDQSLSAARSRVPHHLPEEAEELLAGRVQIINVWRPIRTVRRDPLTVADAHSIEEKDLIPTGLIYPNRRGETLQVAYNPNQKWYYKNMLTPDEVLLIKCYDSKEDGRARQVPHSAFVDPSGLEQEPRQSIEIRALVFHPEDRN